MYRWRMWTAIDGLPFWFCCGNGRVRSPSAEFFGKRIKVHQMFDCLTYGGALGCYRYEEMEDNYG